MASAGAVMVIGSVVGAAASWKAGKDAAKAAKQQQKAAEHQARKQQRIDDIRAQRRRIAGAREKRRVLAQSVNASTSSNTTSSNAIGFQGSVASQYTSAVTASRQTDDLIRDISIFNNAASAQAANLFASSARFGGIADLSKAAGTTASIFKTA